MDGSWCAEELLNDIRFGLHSAVDLTRGFFVTKSFLIMMSLTRLLINDTICINTSIVTTICGFTIICPIFLKDFSLPWVKNFQSEHFCLLNHWICKLYWDKSSYTIFIKKNNTIVKLFHFIAPVFSWDFPSFFILFIMNISKKTCIKYRRRGGQKLFIQKRVWSFFFYWIDLVILIDLIDAKQNVNRRQIL